MNPPNVSQTRSLYRAVHYSDSFLTLFLSKSSPKKAKSSSLYPAVHYIRVYNSESVLYNKINAKFFHLLSRESEAETRVYFNSKTII